MAQAIGKLKDSTAIINDHERCREVLQEHGYLYVRGAFQRGPAEDLRRQIFGEMERQGAVIPGSPDDNFLISSRDAVDEAGLYKNVNYHEFWRSGLWLFEGLLGGPAYIFRNTTMRFAVPNEALYTTPPHQDGASVPSDFFTVWAPLMDVPLELGGLAIADGSHKGGLRLPVNDPAHLSYTVKVPFGHIPLDLIEEPWLSTDFELGDALIFHPWTIHRALPNRSDRVRLSVDTRFEPADAPRNFLTHTELGSEFSKNLDRYISEMPAEQLAKTQQS